MKTKHLMKLIVQTQFVRDQAMAMYYGQHYTANTEHELVESLKSLQVTMDQILNEDCLVGCHHSDNHSPDFTIHGRVFCEDCYDIELGNYEKLEG